MTNVITLFRYGSRLIIFQQYSIIFIFTLRHVWLIVLELFEITIII